MVVDIAATAGATSTGILGLPTLLLFSSYIKYKSKKTSSNRRRFGEVENWSRFLRLSCFHINPLCGESLSTAAEAGATRGPSSGFCPASHSFHKHSTVRKQEEWPEEWKNQWKPLSTRPIAQSAC